MKERTNYTGSGAFTVSAIQFAYFIIIIPSWSEIEDNMAANHVHNKRFADFKYGSFIKALYGRIMKCSYINGVEVKSEVPHI